MHLHIGGRSTEQHSADEIGAKAANLARMAALGLPVPPAFVLPVKLCADIIDDHAHAERHLRDGLKEGIAFLEDATGRRFGDRRQPLLLSVRSGAARSMPGMLDTVLNVGCTSAAVQGLIRCSGRPRLAWDCRRRFLESYTETVLGLEPGPFAALLTELVASEEVASDGELDSEALERLASGPAGAWCEGCGRRHGWLEDAERPARKRRARGISVLDERTGANLPASPEVRRSPRYRGHGAGHGVRQWRAHLRRRRRVRRDPSTGLPEPMIDLVLDAQGEDVVSGRRTPDTDAAVARALPKLRAELGDILRQLEKEFCDVQDVEFAVEDSNSRFATRAAKRTPRRAAASRWSWCMKDSASTKRSSGSPTSTSKVLSRSHSSPPTIPSRPELALRAASRSDALRSDAESAQRLAAAGDPSHLLMRPDYQHRRCRRALRWRQAS